jgi:hypothetical protein
MAGPQPSMDLGGGFQGLSSLDMMLSDETEHKDALWHDLFGGSHEQQQQAAAALGAGA